MRQCRALDGNITIGCYYGDYSSCVTTTFLRPFLFGTNFFAHTCLPPIKVTASYCIASFI